MTDLTPLLLILVGLGALFVVGGILGDWLDRRMLEHHERYDARQRNKKPRWPR